MKKHSTYKQRIFGYHFVLLGGFVVLAVAFYFLMIFNVSYNQNTIFGQYYWAFIGGAFVLLAAYAVSSIIKAKRGKMSIYVNVLENLYRHKFLLKQLVARDFKRKYKRSFLGVIWSFLNPLLLMSTQYFIFSVLFKNDSIKCYVIYLFIGVLTFNFAREASVTGLSSISSNTRLINKVYVPKYAYTLSKIISAAINFLFSLIPFIIIALIMQVWPTQFIFIFILDYILLFFFLWGLGMLLGSIMVFFRDMQFIWSVLIMVWMYATPIFYSIKRFEGRTVGIILKLNPLYHYLNVARTSVIGFMDVEKVIGVAPNVSSFGICLLCSVAMFALGAFVFKRTQDRFILYV